MFFGSSVNQSIYIEPYVASESEAHVAILIA